MADSKTKDSAQDTFEPEKPSIEALDRLLAHFDDDELDVITEAVREGARSIPEAMGVDEAVLNTIETTALHFYRAQFYQKAMSIFYLLVKLDRHRGSAWRGIGACLQASKAYYEAAIAYELAWECDHEDIPSLVFLGEAICQAGEREKGLGLLEEAIERGTDNPDYALYLTRAKAVIQANGERPANLHLKREGQELDG